jgi:hypothetical protein
MSVEFIEGDRRTKHYKSWSKWIASIDKLRRQWASQIDHDPIAYNEVASMSFMATAAVKVNWQALVEYTTVKRGKKDGRENANGRADLWVYDPELDTSWSIEAKQGTKFTNKETEKQKKRVLGAIQDARKVKQSEADQRLALVVTLYDPTSLDQTESLDIDVVICPKFTTTKKARVLYCWKLACEGVLSPWSQDAYLTFYEVD